MKIIFLGTGEAFDETLPNNSHLIISETRLLLDCGYSMPAQLWKYNPDPSFLDAIYISHGHADHYFGLPALLGRMWEEKRTKPIIIICREQIKKDIEKMLELGYAGIRQKFEFSLDFITAEKGKKVKLNELGLSFAPTIHSKPNLAVSIDDSKSKICYSGDGKYTKEAEQMYKGSDLLIHEAYSLEPEKPGHGSIYNLIEMAKKAKIKCLALTHLQRSLRKQKNRLKKIITKKIIVPQPMQEYSL
ncbi:MBL fold metallo-hydrolase [Candidatus Woesearchaeota archaeon]|nr:MBL fold metallo-hydrolase [Candidatus Woesearchaeota archaeon]